MTILRLMIAEFLLGLAIRVAPPQHPNTDLMAVLVKVYVDKALPPEDAIKQARRNAQPK